jgi:hypothetical protein
MGTPLEVHRAEGGGGLEAWWGWRAQGAVLTSAACALTDLAVLVAGMVSGRDGADADGGVMLGAYGEYGATRSLALYRGLMAWRRLLGKDAVAVLEPFGWGHLPGPGSGRGELRSVWLGRVLHESARGEQDVMGDDHLAPTFHAMAACAIVCSVFFIFNLS